MYSDKNLIKGAILHLINMGEKYKALLCMVLCEYWDEILGMLPICARPNCKLGDVNKIALVEDAKLVVHV